MAAFRRDFELGGRGLDPQPRACRLLAEQLFANGLEAAAIVGGESCLIVDIEAKVHR